MNRLILPGLLSLATALLVSCTTDGNVTVGGIPAWVAAGAKLESEPAPYKPDPAIIHFDSESGPLEFQIITDQRKYEAPKVTGKKTSPVSSRTTANRKHDSRIRRLFH